MFFGVFIFALGVMFLLKNLNVIQGDIWGILWPLLIVAFGAALIFKKHGR